MVSKFWPIEGWLWACTLRPARGTSSFVVGVFFRNWMLWLLLLSLSLVAGKFQFEIRSALRFQNHLSGSWKKSWREMPVPRLAPHMSWHCGLDSSAKARGETGLLIARLYREPGNRWGFQAGLSGGCCKSSWDTFTSNRKLQEQT